MTNDFDTAANTRAANHLQAAHGRDILDTARRILAANDATTEVTGAAILTDALNLHSLVVRSNREQPATFDRVQHTVDGISEKYELSPTESNALRVLLSHALEEKAAKAAHEAGETMVPGTAYKAGTVKVFLRSDIFQTMSFEWTAHEQYSPDSDGRVGLRFSGDYTACEVKALLAELQAVQDAFDAWAGNLTTAQHDLALQLTRVRPKTTHRNGLATRRYAAWCMNVVQRAIECNLNPAALQLFYKEAGYN